MSNGTLQAQSETRFIEQSPESLLDKVVKATAASRHSPDDIHRMAVVAAKSGMFKMTADQTEVLMLLAQAEGIEPIRVLAMYDIFNGRPAMKSMYMLARHQASGGIYKWGAVNEKEAECFFAHKTACPEGITIRWTIEDAKKAGLAGKDTYKGYAEDMLVWRVAARGVRRSNPACLFGLDVPEPEELEQPAAVETGTHKTLVDQLKTKLAKAATVATEPAVTMPPVIATVEALKQHSDAAKAAMTEPQSEWGKWIAESVEAFNRELDKLADKNPSDMRFRQHVRVQQVANHIVNEMVEDGTIEKAAIETNGKRDSSKRAAILQSIWDTDPGDLMTSASNYLASKVIPDLSPEPGSDG